MAIHKTTFYGNPYLGMFAKTNDSLTLIGGTALPKFDKALKGLGTKQVKISIANSDLVGLYTVMNNHGILFSSVLEQDGFESFKSSIKRLGLDMSVSISPTKFVSLGNNILVNDNGAAVNPDVDANLVKDIRDVLDVPVEKGTVAGYKTVGAMASVNNKGFLAHPNLTEEESQNLEGVLKVQGGVGTANHGVPFTGICMLANNNAVVFGEPTTGFEVGRALEALGRV